MADEKTGTGEAGDKSPESITNVKGEFNRKIGNLEQQVSSLVESNKALLGQIASMAKPAASAAAAASASDEDTEIEKQWFDNPGKAANLLTQKVTRQVSQQVATAAEANNRKTTTIAELVEEFPELRKTDHPLTKRAVEIYNGLSEGDKSSPIAYKAAVNQAALEHKVQPLSKRDESDEADDFTLSGNGSSGVRQEGRRSRKDDIDPATAEFARMVGVNVDDPKVKERMKNKHGRRTYNRYE